MVPIYGVPEGGALPGSSPNILKGSDKPFNSLDLSGYRLDSLACSSKVILESVAKY